MRFLRERGNPKSLKEEMGLEPKGTVGDKISTPSSKGGKTLEEYVFGFVLKQIRWWLIMLGQDLTNKLYQS